MWRHRADPALEYSRGAASVLGGCCLRRGECALTDRDEEAPAEAPLGYESRRRFLQGAAGTLGVLGASLASPGVFYKMADAIAAPPARPAAGAEPPAQEQYLLQDTQVINVDGLGLQSKRGSVAIHVPPLHDHVITAKLKVSANPAALQEAQAHLESVLVPALTFGMELTFTIDQKGHAESANFRADAQGGLDATRAGIEGATNQAGKPCALRPLCGRHTGRRRRVPRRVHTSQCWWRGRSHDAGLRDKRHL